MSVQVAISTDSRAMIARRVAEAQKALEETERNLREFLVLQGNSPIVAVVIELRSEAYGRNCVCDDVCQSDLGLVLVHRLSSWQRVFIAGRVFEPASSGIIGSDNDEKRLLIPFGEKWGEVWGGNVLIIAFQNEVQAVAWLKEHHDLDIPS